MRRAALRPLTVLLGLFAAEVLLAQTSPPVGRVIEPKAEAVGGIPPAARLPLKPGGEVRLGMEVATDGSGAARIALQRPKRGSVRIGPDTKLMFSELVLTGRPPVSGLRMAFGQIRLALIPEGNEPGAGEYWIETHQDNGEVRDRIRLLGTDVYLRVDRLDGSVVLAVVDGKVEVETEAGAKVEVNAGQWTSWGPGQLAPDARPIGPGDGGTLPPGFPGDAVVIDPPGLDDLRFDLPR